MVDGFSGEVSGGRSGLTQDHRIPMGGTIVGYIYRNMNGRFSCFFM